MKQITVLVENRVGALADVLEALGGVGVNLKSISAQGERNSGVIRFITRDEMTAARTLKKAGFNIIVGDVITLTIRDRPGELAKIARRLSDRNVNIECIYLLSRGKEGAELAIKTDNVAEAVKVLRL